MRFLIDNQLPRALVQALVGAGHSAEHVLDLGMGQADDTDIWEHARSTGAVIVTKDEDFPIIRRSRSEGPAVVWIRSGNVRRADFIIQFLRLLPEILIGLQSGELIVEVT